VNRITRGIRNAKRQQVGSEESNPQTKTEGSSHPGDENEKTEGCDEKGSSDKRATDGCRLGIVRYVE
jgi:hypothetical protein